jgi:nucleoside-diphosphate-sugar epimerase
LHLVIGAGEFLGSHVARALAADVPAIELRADADDAALREAISGVEVVVFCAETAAPGHRVRFRRRPPALLQRVLDAARPARVRRFVHVSTADVFGSGQSGRVNERSPLDPAHAYEKAKLFEEDWLLEAAAGLVDVVIVRPARVFGVGDDWILPRLVSAAVRGRVWLPDGGHARQTFVAAEDVGRACLAASDRGRPGHRYLVGGFDATWRDVLISAARAVGFAAEVGSVPFDLAYLAAIGGEMFTPPETAVWPGTFAVDVIGRPRLYDDSWSRRELTWSPSVGSFEQDAAGMAPWLARLPEVEKALADARAVPLEPGAGVTSPPGR